MTRTRSSIVRGARRPTATDAVAVTARAALIDERLKRIREARDETLLGSAERRTKWLEATQETHDLYDAVGRVMRRSDALLREAVAVRGGGVARGGAEAAAAAGTTTP